MTKQWNLTDRLSVSVKVFDFRTLVSALTDNCNPEDSAALKLGSIVLVGVFYDTVVL